MRAVSSHLFSLWYTDFIKQPGVQLILSAAHDGKDSGGVDDDYETLDALKASTKVRGRMTAELELTDAVPMKLQHVQSYDDGAVWLRYSLRP